MSLDRTRQIEPEPCLPPHQPCIGVALGDAGWGSHTTKEGYVINRAFKGNAWVRSVSAPSPILVKRELASRTA